MHILLTVLHTFLVEQGRRIFLNIKTSYFLLITSFLSLECLNNRFFNRNLSRWQNFRSRQRMNYSRQRREIVGGLGVCSPRKFWKFGPLRVHFLHSGARIRVFKQNRKHRSLLKLLRIQVGFFCFSWINLRPIQCSYFVANVSHVSRKIWGNFSIK